MGVDTYKIDTKIRMWDVRSLSTQKLVCAPVCLSTKTNHTRNSGLPQLKKNAHRGKERPDKNGDGDALYDRTSFRTKQNIA
jgi:hypothetical protein